MSISFNSTDALRMSRNVPVLTLMYLKCVTIIWVTEDT